MKKILIIRFSSFGDIIQNLSVISELKARFSPVKIHFATRSDMKELPLLHPEVDKVWALDRSEGVAGLFRFAKLLSKEDFDLVYDAHNNLRSFVLVWYLRFFAKGFRFLRRSKKRFLRFLLFSLRMDFLKKDRKGMFTYKEPLASLGISPTEASLVRPRFPEELLSSCRKKIKEKVGEGVFITLAPSAAWEMKRWPSSHWEELIRLMPENKFIILGGPADYFCSDLEALDPKRVFNFAGKLSLMESCAFVKLSPLLIVADTGLLHVADLFGISTIALLGPTAFGFPSGKHVKIMEVPLKCRPCTKDGRGECSQEIYQRCLAEISPEEVALEGHRMLAN